MPGLLRWWWHRIAGGDEPPASAVASPAAASAAAGGLPFATSTVGAESPADADPVTTPMGMLNLRDRLEIAGLGQSAQAIHLDRAFILHREVIVAELAPYLADLDRRGVPRTYDSTHWWWYLDKPAMVRRVCARMGLPTPADDWVDDFWMSLLGDGEAGY